MEIYDRPLHDNATYRTLFGNDDASTPLTIGLQTSPPGFNTDVHWHPYMEIVIVLEGFGKAWIEGEGEVKSMKTYGIHASPNRVV